MKPGWSKPSTILFASEIPANEKAFAFALAQAREFGADLILFHAYDTLVVAASETSGIRYYDYAAAARTEKQHLEPLAAARARRGPRCEVVVRPGSARRPDSRLHARARDRPHRDGHALAGPHRQAAGGFGGRSGFAHRQGAGVISSVPMWSTAAIATLPRAPFSAPSACMRPAAVVAAFAAELAAQHNARLILQHVIRPQERAEFLAGRIARRD